MLKTYRIFPLVFILFLFGFTLIIVAPDIANSFLPFPQQKLNKKQADKALEHKKQDDELKWHVRNMIGIHADDRCDLATRQHKPHLCKTADDLYNRLLVCQKLGSIKKGILNTVKKVTGGSNWEKCFRDGLTEKLRNKCGRYCWCAIEGISKRKRQQWDCRAEKGAAWREDTIWMMKGYYHRAGNGKRMSLE